MAAEAMNGEQSLLLQAAQYGNHELLTDLLSGEFVQQLDCRDGRGRSAVHFASTVANVTCLELLIRAGADVNACSNREDGSQTPLHVASMSGNVDACRILTTAGADLLATNSAGYTPLEVSQMANEQGAARVLLDAMEERQQKLDELSARVDTACMRGDLAAMETALSEAADVRLYDDVLNGKLDDYSPLYRACERGHKNVVEALLKREASGRIHPVTFYSPLYIAAYAGHKGVVALLLSRFPDLVQVLTVEKWLPIHAAAHVGDAEMIKLLFEFNYPTYVKQRFYDRSGYWCWQAPFDINEPDGDCRTPLFIATAEGHADAVRILVNHTVTAREADSLTTDTENVDEAIEATETYEDVVHAVKEPMGGGGSDSGSETDGFDTLKKARLKLNTAKDASTSSPPMKVIRPAAIDVYDASGHTPLHMAVIKRHTDIVTILLDAGADVNLPLALTDDDLIRLQAEEIQISGSGALIEACNHGDNSLVDLLLEHGAVDQDNKALAVCVKNRNDSLACKLLVRHTFADPEFRVNKKCLDVESIQYLSKGRSVAPSTLCPGCPVMLSWHSGNLDSIQERWLLEAALQLNPKLRTASPFSSSIVLTAITRIDVAKNRIRELPLAVFQLASLRILNAANNLLETIPSGGGNNQDTPKRREEKSSSSWNCPVLEELHLEHNHLESLPKIVFELPNLIGLDVSNNALTTLPSNFWFSPKLKDINVSGNQLRFLPTIERESRRNASVSESGIEQDFMLGSTTPDETHTRASSSTGAASGSSPTVSIKSNDPNNTATTTTTGSTSLGGAGGGGLNDGDADERSSIGSFRLFRQDDRLSFQELKRHNLWQKSVGLTQQYDDDESTGETKEHTKSCLTSLNLSSNLFERIPDGLPCLSPALSRLTMAHNRLTEIGPVNVFPPRLKHLDLSNNRIAAWFGVPYGYDGCGSAAAASGGGSGGTASAGGLGGGRRATRSPVVGSRSASAVRNQRSLSVARNTPDSALSPTCCAHRRHVRLANLRTLVLANNLLEYVQLTAAAPSTTPMTAVLSHRTESASSRRSTTSSNASSRRSASMARKSTSESQASTASSPTTRQTLVFPNLSMLDLSSNILRFIPPEISEVTSLSVLNLSSNSLVSFLPPEMGLLSRLWNLNLNGCNMSEPLKSMLDSKRYKTMDIIGYLKSVLEDSRPYARLKLMIVGVQGIGKTSLLEQLRQEGTASTRKANDGWAKRMGHKNINQKTKSGVNISTVGVDVGDWIYEPKKTKNQPTFGPVTFRTWDFGGQREYYSTHQYFLSKRSLYLAVWRVTDGEAGVNEITQWLVNIQARAPNAPVIIVGTHYDEVLNNSKKFPQAFVEDLQRQIRERFVAVQDADKKGLPRVIDSVIVSCKSRFNIRVLCDLIHRCAYELRLPGTKERLLEQKIPASYLALEEIVAGLAHERRAQGKDCVLSTEQYRSQVQEAMRKVFGKPFRDNAELSQATAFLHDNGVLLHYDDSTLKDMYFLDPQWLCDILAHVITIREINPFAKNGVMKTDDLKILFKSSTFAPANIRTYLLSLLQKFEVGLSWDNRTLLIPSLLPDEYQLRAGYPGCEVKIPVRSKGWAVKISKKQNESNSSAMNSTPIIYLKHGRDVPLFELKQHSESSSEINDKESSIALVNNAPMDENESKKAKFVPLFTLNRPKPTVDDQSGEFYVNRTVNENSTIRRLYLMAYFPSGFWSRLITRILGDETIPTLFDQFFKFSGEILQHQQGNDKKLHRILETNRAEWMLWQSGLEIQFMGHTLFSLKEFLPLAEVRDINYKEIKFKYRQDNSWSILDAELSSILELYIPDTALSLRYQGEDGRSRQILMETDSQVATKLLSNIIDTLDTLLEDWYPTLGTRFVHTSEGKYLVTRLVPCSYCLAMFVGKSDVQASQDETWTVLSLRGGGDQKKTTTTTAELRKDDGRMAKSKTFDNAAVLNNAAKQQAETKEVPVVQEKNSYGHRSASLTEFAPNALPRPSVVNPGNDKISYTFTVEECILAAHDATVPVCPMHGPMPLPLIAPDTVFLDLGESYLIVPEQVKRGKMLGRGAFGFVFKASVKMRGQNHAVDVALKMLQPVDPGFGAKPSAVTAFKAAYAKWQRDPTQYACRAYCTARQELNVLLNLKHANVVPFLGVSPRPLSIALGLAPLGSLNTLLQNYRRSGARLHLSVVQETSAQVSKALEYLHQQHVIYRDLKSENVLVWQFPPPFSQLTTVEVKLGDYGISRSVLPTGGAKGFGGTEGFMAPEIMRYNGEEEYTEKVDCFSFGMFLYELLSLKLPFEGQEQVKEYLLDGGRPTLTAKELLYPCNVLDLMVMCWSHQPAERPSSSQLVSVTTAPEFSHLLDVVSLSDSDSAVIAGDAFVVEEGNPAEEASNIFEGETWLSRVDGQVSILSCNQHGWLDYKVKQNVSVNDDSFITAVCLVDDTIWLGERTGVVRIFCARTYTEMHSFSLAPYVLPNEDSPKHQFILPASEIVYLVHCRAVLITISQPGALMVCPVANALSGGGANPPVSASIRSVKGEINCTCVLPQHDRSMNAWCGHTSGYISIYEVDASSIVQLAVVNHYDPVLDGLEVSRLVSSSMSGRYVWSYVYPGCTLYQWDATERAIIAKLDCSKIAPCSESINTINIEERLSPGRCQVTALCLVEKEDGPQLYIGTTWGVVIVAEADQLRPCTAFRPHVEEIRLIMAISQQKRAVLSTPLSRLRPTCSSSIGIGGGGSSSQSHRTSEHQPASPATPNPAAIKSSSKENRKADAAISSPFLHTPRMEAFNNSSMGGHNGTYLITVGKGYRALMQRFLDAFKEEGDVVESRKKDIFAILWRTDDWVNF